MKTNKNCLKRNTIALIIAMLICFCTAVHAQAVSGIFLSAEDFQKEKLSFVKVGNTECKIKIRSDFPHKKIQIKCGKSIRYLSKDSVYGYKDKFETKYRLYKGLSYVLMNPGEKIQLYMLQISPQTKIEAAIIHYYFSPNAESMIYSLSINNILKTFQTNKHFTEIIELRYHYDSELLEYDSFHKKYKINRLLEISNN